MFFLPSPLKLLSRTATVQPFFEVYVKIPIQFSDIRRFLYRKKSEFLTDGGGGGGEKESS